MDLWQSKGVKLDQIRNLFSFDWRNAVVGILKLEHFLGSETFHEVTHVSVEEHICILPDLLLVPVNYFLAVQINFVKMSVMSNRSWFLLSLVCSKRLLLNQVLKFGWRVAHDCIKHSIIGISSHAIHCQWCLISFVFNLHVFWLWIIHTDGLEFHVGCQEMS